MTLSVHYINVHTLLTKDIKEYRYVVIRDDQVTIGVAKSLKKSLELYKTHKGIRTLAEAVWRACALGIRYDLVHEDPQPPALREIEDILLSHIKRIGKNFTAGDLTNRHVRYKNFIAFITEPLSARAVAEKVEELPKSNESG